MRMKPETLADRLREWPRERLHKLLATAEQVRDVDDRDRFTNAIFNEIARRGMAEHIQTHPSTLVN